MASIIQQITLEVDADRAWAALRDVGHAHHVFAGVLVDARVSGDVERTVTFADGMVVRERIVDVDDDARRLAYSVQDLFAHHHATMTVTPSAAGSTLTWVTDLLPDDAAPMVDSLMAQGLQAAAASLSG